MLLNEQTKERSKYSTTTTTATTTTKTMMMTTMTMKERKAQRYDRGEDCKQQSLAPPKIV